MSYGDSRAISLIVKSTAPNLNVYLWNRRRVSLLTPWRKWKRYAHIRIGYTRFISNSKKHEYSFIQDHNKYLVLVFVRLNFTLVIVKHKKKRKQFLGFFLFSCKIASFQFFFFSNIFTLCRYLSLNYRGLEARRKCCSNILRMVFPSCYQMEAFECIWKLLLQRTIFNAIFICEKIFSKVTLNSFIPK